MHSKTSIREQLKVVCIDATHGLNPYGIKLITIIIKDENEEGFPIAHCFSNREDFVVLKLFFTLLEKEVGNIPSECVMTDDAIQYYTAWTAVFEYPQQVLKQISTSSGHNTDHSIQPATLLCWWHVKKSIAKNVLLKVPDKQGRDLR